MRHFTSDARPEQRDADRYFNEGWLRPHAPLAATAGAHRFVWDLRYPRPQAIKYGYSIAATWDSDTPMTPEGALALPGTYQLVLTVDGKAYRAPLTVTMDPRVTIDPAGLADALDMSRHIGDTLEQIWRTHGEVQSLRDRLDALDRHLARDTAHAALLSEAKTLRHATDPLVSGGGEQSRDLAAINDALTGIATDIEGADRAPTAGQQEAYAEYQANLQRALKLWRDTTATSLAALNAHLRAAGMKPIRMTAPKLPPPSEPEED